MSTTPTPAPAAMRRLRLEFRIEGFSRSAGVIERMIASVCAMAFSSIFAPVSALASSPGIIPARSCSDPMFFMELSWSR